MSIFTLDSTFEDIKTLLEEGDICFEKTIKNTFEEVSKDEELKNAFCFFMAMALGGVGNSNKSQKRFSRIIWSNSTEKNEWSICVRKFVNSKKNDKLGDDFNELLSKMHDSSLENIYKNGIKDLKYTDKKDGKVEEGYVFGIGKKWWFAYEKIGEENIQEPKDGKIPPRVDKEIQAIIDCLIKQFNKEYKEYKEYEIKKIPQYDLLLANKQLIMNGAPGTGKTYSARNIIADILFDTSCKGEKGKEEIKKVRMDMVQFHPSYDYTDFIDGIRPDLSGNELKYSLKNGSFKSFCCRAGVIERIYATGKPVEPDTLDKFLSGEDESIKNFWKAEIEKERLKQEIEKVNKSLDITEFDTSKLPSFLFIIDEINRAEISKVFGEIMYCLDPDYRGVKGAISTQYSALATDKTFFINKDNDKFFIPSNVYIIGTMNDIDRSVEVFDFALRRRFAWYEVKVDVVMDDILKSMEVDTLLGQNYEDYKAKIDALNNAIVDALKLNKHYHLGPSYFAKISLYYDETKKNYEEAKEKVWNNHILQILNEYVKGRGKENEVEGIGEAFISI